MSIDSETRNNKQLIVLLPQSLAGKTDLAREVNKQAARRGMDVLYLALLDNPEGNLAAARAMATMKAVTSDHHLAVQSRLVPVSNWQKILQDSIQLGDTVLCFAEQTVRTGMFTTKPVCVYLQEIYGLPVQALSGWYHPAHEQIKTILNQVIAWAGFLFILVTFSILEVNLDRTVHGVNHAILLGLFLLVEFGLILAWNRLTQK